MTQAWKRGQTTDCPRYSTDLTIATTQLVEGKLVHKADLAESNFCCRQLLVDSQPEGNEVINKMAASPIWERLSLDTSFALQSLSSTLCATSHCERIGTLNKRDRYNHDILSVVSSVPVARLAFCVRKPIV